MRHRARIRLLVFPRPFFLDRVAPDFVAGSPDDLALLGAAERFGLAAQIVVEVENFAGVFALGVLVCCGTGWVGTDGGVHPRQRFVAAFVFVDVQAGVSGLLLEQGFSGFAQEAHAVPRETGGSGAGLVAAGFDLGAGFADASAQRVVFEAGGLGGAACVVGAA